MATYKTEQRNELIRFMTKNSQKAFSIDEISTGMEEDCSFSVPPGKSTIYRLIPKLVDENVVKEFTPTHSRRKVYQIVGDKTCASHMHLKCQCCGKILHMSNQMTENLSKLINENDSFIMNIGETTIFGLCKDCK